MPDALAPLLIAPGDLAWMLVDAFLALLAVVLAVRIVGLRSFAKMSSFDFAVTVATGSLLASVLINQDRSFVHAFAVIGALLVAQWVIAKGRVHLEWFRDAVDNTPLLIMRDGEILHENMRKGRLTEADVYAKLREANVLDLAQVRAFVLETTGDVSVLHGEGPVDEALLDGVRR